MINTAYHYFQSLNARERLAVSICGAFLLAVFFWLILIKPAFDHYQGHRNNLEEMHALDLWIAHNQGRLESIADEITAVSADDLDLIQLINSSAEKYSIEVNRLEPEQNDSVRTTFSDVAFPDFMNMLALLEYQPIEVISLNIDATIAPGFVNASVIIAKR